MQNAKLVEAKRRVAIGGRCYNRGGGKTMPPTVTLKVHYGDNLPVLQKMPAESVTLIYIDPPFNTGKKQRLERIRAIRDEEAHRTGFQGAKYCTIRLGAISFADRFEDFLGFMQPRLREAHRVLAPKGALYLHLDYREVHYCKVLLDSIFGEECFLNEIIWAYDYGARTRSKWPPKHDSILVYVKDPRNYIFNYEEIDRIPYMAPGLVGPEKAARGKTPTDVWWQTIVPTNGSERTGYPTQKPIAVLSRIIRASSNPGDLVLDFFAGSGTTGEAACKLGRSCILVDNNPEALRVMEKRFASIPDVEFVGWECESYGKVAAQPRLVKQAKATYRARKDRRANRHQPKR
jgi:site-specific DNA-methyltransferase (adenine-specific)